MRTAFKKGLVVFAAFLLLVLYGFRTEPIYTLKETVKAPLMVLCGKESLTEMKEKLTAVYDGERLAYHHTLIDLNSLYLRYSGAKSVKKEDSTIVVTQDKLLTDAMGMVSDESMRESVSAVDKLYRYCQDAGTDFLYVACPVKGYRAGFPAGIDNYATSNYDRFCGQLKQSGIPTLVMQEKMDEEGITRSDAFFVTDHHWTPETGFWATTKILEELEQRYRIPYHTEYTDLENYNITVYEDWFLGSHGRKVGAYFLDSGPDNISVITPKFDTSFIAELPFRNDCRSGSFSETVLSMDRLLEKDLYEENAYTTYCGGDFRMQIFRNQLAENNRKVLIIRDSFACVVAPFLALQNSTLYLVDLRDFADEKPNVYRLIDEIQPDCVLILYSLIPGIFDFE